MERRIIKKFANVSEEYTTSIFRAEENQPAKVASKA
jgi:hypothetical protein